MNHYVVDTWDDDASDVYTMDRHSVMLTQMTSNDILAVEKIFKKYDAKNQGYVDPKYALPIFKAAGQYPSLEVEQDLIQEANQSETGMILFPELITVFKKYWKSEEFALNELKEAVQTFGSKSNPELKREEDENDMIEMEKLSEALALYGEKLDAKDVQLFEKVIFKADLVKEKKIQIPIKDFVEILVDQEAKKKNKDSKNNKGKGKKPKSKKK